MSRTSEFVDLRDLEGEELEMWKKAIEDQTGYNFDDLKENEPIMIANWHFEDYAQELAEDIGAINRDMTWPQNCIDWEQASDELKQDYTRRAWKWTAQSIGSGRINTISL